MRNKIIGFVICLVVLGLFALIFNLYFEIAEYEEFTRPSIEALTNDFLALERWLLSNGYEVRVEINGDYHSITSSFEDIIFIQSDNFTWDKDSIDLLLQRVESGLTLILSLHFSRFWPEQSVLGEFLEYLGLKAFYPEEGYSFLYDSNSPSFSRNISFTEPENASLILRDAEDYIRLVEIQQGQGKIIVMGRSRFLENNSLESSPNARLAWYLFTEEEKNMESYSRSVFFIRGEIAPEGLISGFFQRGNFLIIIIASAVLIVIGFWAALPVFGIVKENIEVKGKTLSERFLAEGRFFKRYNALGAYRTLYVKEIKRMLHKKDNQDNDKINEYIITQEGQPKDIKQFSKSVVILKNILERL